MTSQIIYLFFTDEFSERSDRTRTKRKNEKYFKHTATAAVMKVLEFMNNSNFRRENNTF